jgi:hypothetical protein
MLVRSRLLALPVVAMLALSACFGKDIHNPGTPIGTFHVDGTLKSNACGDSLGAPADWQFDVKLSEDPHILYWVQGGMPVQGTLDASSHATMQSQSSQVMHGADGGTPYCAIMRSDTLDVTLAQDLATFTATLTYTFDVGDGSVCDDQMAQSGGPYATLPCAVTYALTGTKSTPAK